MMADIIQTVANAREEEKEKREDAAVIVQYEEEGHELVQERLLQSVVATQNLNHAVTREAVVHVVEAFHQGVRHHVHHAVHHHVLHRDHPIREDHRCSKSHPAIFQRTAIAVDIVKHDLDRSHQTIRSIR